MRFKTSATYLRTLFPTPSFRFASPGTMAEASFQCTQLDGLPWLGGRGYNFFGLWIHGVEYAKKDESTLSGSFLPILFEDLADPIITGREELGMPKVFCDIDVARNGDRTSVTCSWRGTSFAIMTLEGLVDEPGKHDTNGDGRQEGPPRPADNGLLVYRYVPAVGQRGVADAEYPVFMGKDETSTQRVVEKTHTGRTGRVQILPGDWDSLPTLHHIVSGLADIPVYEVLVAKTEKGRGMENFSQAQRVD